MRRRAARRAHVDRALDRLRDRLGRPAHAVDRHAHQPPEPSPPFRQPGHRGARALVTAPAQGCAEGPRTCRSPSPLAMGQLPADAVFRGRCVGRWDEDPLQRVARIRAPAADGGAGARGAAGGPRSGHQHRAGPGGVRVEPRRAERAGRSVGGRVLLAPAGQRHDQQVAGRRAERLRG